MKICYLDTFSGISGDMLVGALADAGAPSSELIDGLESLGVQATFRFERTKRNSIGATKFAVEGAEQKAHRHLSHILELIEKAAIPARAKRDARMVFERLGDVEAKVHGIPVEKVHFHEVGAADSIADIVGACLGFELLGVEAIYSSPLNLGSGTTRTEHGMLPVPAPATAALVSGVPVYARGPEMELTTPTGAAIVTTLARGFGVLPPMKISATGYGAGDHDFVGQPNVLRVLIGDSTNAKEATLVTVIEANLDDTTPEILGYAMGALLEKGALDVTLTPLIMKKNRPGVLLRVIARPEEQEKLTEVVFEETTTLGLRVYPAERRVQARRVVEVQTSYGKVRMKVSSDGSYAPEYEDCRRLAQETGTPLKRILADANFAYVKSHR